MSKPKKQVIERYIPTSHDEADAIISGTKTQIVIPVHKFGFGGWRINVEWPKHLSYCREKNPEGWYFWGDMQGGPNPWDVKQWYQQIPAPQVGEIIFLAEHHRRATSLNDGMIYAPIRIGIQSEGIYKPLASLTPYAQIYAQSMPKSNRWRGPLAMPRLLSRFVASITNVSAQRVKDCNIKSKEWNKKLCDLGLAKRPFRYGDNPWCWVIDIQKVQA